MTKKQKIFADEYLIDLNATRAYKVAYPSVKKDETAAQAGSRMLRNVKVSGDLFQSCEVIHRDKNRNTVVTEATCLFLSGLKYKGSNDLLLHHIERFKQN